jgi:hypothetical protein
MAHPRSGSFEGPRNGVADRTIDEGIDPNPRTRPAPFGSSRIRCSSSLPPRMERWRLQASQQREERAQALRRQFLDHRPHRSPTSTKPHCLPRSRLLLGATGPNRAAYWRYDTPTADLPPIKMKKCTLGRCIQSTAARHDRPRTVSRSSSRNSATNVACQRCETPPSSGLYSRRVSRPSALWICRRSAPSVAMNWVTQAFILAPPFHRILDPRPAQVHCRSHREPPTSNV